jgi:hypothetical protein
LNVSRFGTGDGGMRIPLHSGVKKRR